MIRFKEYLKENEISIYRGQSVHNKKGGPLGGKFYSTDKSFAHQFTQSGQDHEIHHRKIKESDILDHRHVYAGDDIEPHIHKALKAGKKAVRFNEGPGQPDSIYVLKEEALIHRGISHGELDSIIRTGKIKSKG